MKDIQDLEDSLFHVQINNIKELYGYYDDKEYHITGVFLDGPIAGQDFSFNLTQEDLNHYNLE